LILDKLKNREERLFYAGKAVENGWSRNVLAHQIELHLFDRIGKLPNNFSNTLPAAHSDLARELFKDPYKFDFFQLSEEAKERDLENALVDHISRFLVEMGRGFAYVGRQEHLEHQGNDYYIDLLLYHLKLHCYVVLELKVGEFKPEYTGKMNFYLSLIDKKRKATDDKPSIGIILCRSKNNVTVEYALRDINKPIGVAGYEVNFTNAIPEDLKGDLPTIEDLEQELQREVNVQISPLAEKINAFKNFVTSLGKTEMKGVESSVIKDDLFTYTLVNLKTKLNQILQEVNEMFLETSIAPMCNGNLYDKMDEHSILAEFALESESNIIKSIGLCTIFNGFRSAGTNAFVSRYQLLFSFDNFKYWVGPGNPLIEIWIEKRYDESWSDSELTELAERWVGWMISHIQNEVEKMK
jgi:predicted nuclease of restriction endonuclease-like (RecB) superfamily